MSVQEGLMSILTDSNILIKQLLVTIMMPQALLSIQGKSKQETDSMNILIWHSYFQVSHHCAHLS